jgi:nucleoside-diphosphate-sugar epimerase
MKLVVTGAGGFIGGYIIEEALARGYEVVGIDNLSKYGYVTRSFEGVKGYKFFKGDARDSEFLLRHFKEADHVIAGAAMIGGISYFHSFQYDLLATNERIIASTCDAAIQAVKSGELRKVTYISSSMVYESTEQWPSKEGDELVIPPPRSSYGFQKLALEYFARAARDQYGLSYTILRPFNCVGVGEGRALVDKKILSGNISLAMSHVVPDLIQKTLKGQKPLRILGNGTQVRCYTYGEDIARGVLDSIESPRTIDEDYNLSSSVETTVAELAKQIWTLIHGDDAEFELLCEPPFIHDVNRRIPSTLKAKEHFGFEARTSLFEMLHKVIPWVKSAIERDLI